MSAQKFLAEDVERIDSNVNELFALAGDGRAVGGDRIDSNVNELFAKVFDLADRIENLEEELAEEKRKRKAAESVAETALGVANSVDDGARGDGVLLRSRRRSFCPGTRSYAERSKAPDEAVPSRRPR